MAKALAVFTKAGHDTPGVLIEAGGRFVRLQQPLKIYRGPVSVHP